MSGGIFCDVAVIGGGPAGLAAAAAADRAGAKVLLVEREARLGGILKQCIHDGFGLIRFGEKLSGPEYAQRYIDELRKTRVETRLSSFVTRAERDKGGFILSLVNAEGVNTVRAKTLILSTGCRERTARQVAIHGSRPAGILSAGTAQYYTNILGRIPARRCVILGSGDIGLIMARRLYLEGVEVIGVYEAKPTPSGLSRNIVQCLDDFGIPLHTGRSVSRVFGSERLEAVEIVAVDGAMRPIPGTEERIACDGLILSVGLIPENELAESLGVPLHKMTRGPVCDQHCQTQVEGIFSCGNALQVNDLVDYVSESGKTAGQSAALYAANGGERSFADFSPDEAFLSMIPQRLDLDHLEEETTVFFRSRNDREKTLVRVGINGKEVFNKKYNHLRPPEMERITLHLKDAGLRMGDHIRFIME